MTETQTQTQTMPAGAKSRSPEYRLAAGALSGLRQDLFKDPFAYRPLPPWSPDGPLLRRLPERVRRYAVWTPHAVVVGAALFTLMLSLTVGESMGGGLLHAVAGFVPAVAVAMTLLRPVGAWWISLVSTPFVAVLGGEGFGAPWAPAGFFAHIVVMTVAAVRTRPRAAAWMWAGTAAFGFFASVLWYSMDSDTGPMLVISALALLVTTTVHVRREAKVEVTAQRQVTAVERDRRTLLEERTNIARELHDVVAHHMSVVAIQAEAAPYRVENPPPELEQAFVTIRENAVAALTELRRVLGVVRAEGYEAPDAPQPTLADLGRLLENVREAGLQVGQTVTGAVRDLPQGVELSAYRIVQEALSNALRHAPGAEARVEVSYVLGGLGLRVVNGPPAGLVKPPARPPTTTPHRGLRPPLSMGAGHGITGMRERIAMLSGEMTAGPTADGGYEVAAFVPVASPEPEPEPTKATATETDRSGDPA
ncbi:MULTISPECIES: sensor histidine kinase [unclassified Streptomyces]|uniref:sensor histidine kinase n=1 Tax=unclassified Streptomyces TaxID=2593676 RepID=UPI0036ECA15D